MYVYVYAGGAPGGFVPWWCHRVWMSWQKKSPDGWWNNGERDFNGIIGWTISSKVRWHDGYLESCVCAWWMYTFLYSLRKVKYIRMYMRKWIACMHKAHNWRVKSFICSVLYDWKVLWNFRQEHLKAFVRELIKKLLMIDPNVSLYVWLYKNKY